MTQLEEPVLESAPLARQLAPRLCRTDPATGASCAWNHGFWQYLRALGMVTTPQHHADFFAQALGKVDSGSATPRVLISGAADYSMLAHVLWAFGARRVVPRITVVDLCETPLALNDWYARRANLQIERACCNVLDYRGSAPCDAVCSHSFLGQFAPAERRRLMAKWRELLRPGGLVATVNRIRPGSGPGRLGFTPEQAQAFRGMVARKAAALREQLDVLPVELEEWAAAYAARQSAYPVASREELVELFEAAGFRLDQVSCAGVAGAARTPVSGPTAPGGAEYACVIATRR